MKPRRLFVVVAIVVGLGALGVACGPVAKEDSARSFDLVRGHALHRVGQMPEDTVGLEEFYCDGTWLEQSRVRREGRYHARGNDVCVEPIGGATFCRTFARADQRDRLLDVTGRGGADGAEYSLGPSSDAPCK